MQISALPSATEQHLRTMAEFTIQIAESSTGNRIDSTILREALVGIVAVALSNAYGVTAQ